MKLGSSLLVKYMGVIALYLLLLPLLFVVFLLGYNVYHYGNGFVNWQPSKYTLNEIEETWHETAQRLTGLSEKQKIKHLLDMKQKYPESTLFWVDEHGELRFKRPTEADLPQKWTPSMIVKFMKESVWADPFTVVALLGEQESDGFIVIQMPRKYTESSGASESIFSFWVLIGASICLFIFLSWLFFNRIRRRLLNLQNVMQEAQNTGQFRTVSVHNHDEIADLEHSFNRMAVRLQESRERERQEERLRRELIANLSHDLRTPLTVLRGQAYQLKQEALSEEGQQSLKIIDDKIRYLGELIENLLSFSLLSAGKYPFRPEKKDVVRLLRSIVASWYPILEKEGFEVDVNLPDEPVYWEVDPLWFQRIWDNLFQNVLRHAKDGKYVGVTLEKSERGTCLRLADRGPGLDSPSAAKGTGIGLSIVSLMAEEMGLVWRMESGGNGTRCFLCKL